MDKEKTLLMKPDKSWLEPMPFFSEDADYVWTMVFRGTYLLEKLRQQHIVEVQ